MMHQSETAVSLEGVQKRFGTFQAVRDATFDVRKGEFLVLLGPSGSGKTTVLRLIAGFEQPDGGTIRIFGQTANLIPPSRRDIGLVFQHFALFPHLSVRRNIAFGLEVRKLPKREIEERVAATLELVRLGGLADRMPNELSGGQKQRVAIARAVVTRPKVLLLDEPLGSLDAGLRVEMQAELKRLQSELHITTVMVTHDQEEAMAIADRIAVMRDGELLQLDTPATIYARPNSAFVARFMGAANVLHLSGSQADGGMPLETEEGILLTRALAVHAGPAAGAAIIRPERIRLSVEEPTESNRVRVTIESAINLGHTTRCRVRTTQGVELSVVVPAGLGPSLQPGHELWASWSENDNWLVPQ